MYYTYMLRCEDNSLYTGITNNIENRFNQHITGKGAKYTKSHKVKKIEAIWRSKDKSLASKLEYQIKQLTKSQKEDLINSTKLNTYLKDKIDSRRYYKVNTFENLTSNSTSKQCTQTAETL